MTEAIDTADEKTLVVGAQGLRAGDEIVGFQQQGESDRVRKLRDRVVEVGAGEHRTGGECVQLRPVLPGQELNYWKGSDYFDHSLFHVVRRTG